MLLEAAPGIEPGIWALQALALPLGHAASFKSLGRQEKILGPKIRVNGGPSFHRLTPVPIFKSAPLAPIPPRTGSPFRPCAHISISCSMFSMTVRTVPIGPAPARGLSSATRCASISRMGFRQ